MMSPQEHIDRAISLNPEESTLHHLRGRFCFEVCVRMCVCVNIPHALLPCVQVAGVSWLEKKAAAALFGTPPESTYQEALDSLMQVSFHTHTHAHTHTHTHICTHARTNAHTHTVVLP